jgi:hypothetical protein
MPETHTHTHRYALQPNSVTNIEMTLTTYISIDATEPQSGIKLSRFYHSFSFAVLSF